MPKGDYLGEFEQLVLLAVVRLDAGAYGMAIRREIEERAGRSTSIGAVYRTLDRLERKGLLRSHEEAEPTPVPGGRARRFFKLEPDGARALQTSRRMLRRMWEDVRLEVDG